MKKILAAVGIAGLVWAVKKAFDINEEAKASDAVRFKREYERVSGKPDRRGNPCMHLDIPVENPIVYTSLETITKRMRHESMVVYLGFKQCPWCRNVLMPFLEACRLEGVKEVCYCDCRRYADRWELDSEGQPVCRKLGDPHYYELLEFMGDQARSYEGVDGSLKRLYYPTFLFIKDGQLVDVQIGSLDTVEDPYRPLDEEDPEYRELVQRFRIALQKHSETFVHPDI